MPWPPSAPLPEKRQVNDPIPPSNDFGLFLDWATEAMGLQILDMITAKANFVQTNRPLKLIVQETDPNITSDEEMWLNTGGGSIEDSGFLSDRAISKCSTIPPFLVTTTLTLVNGGVNAALAINKQAKTYTQARFLLTGWTTSPTDLYIVAYGADGSVLGSTPSLVSQATAAGVMITGTFKTPIALSESTKVYLAIVCIGGSGLNVARGSFAGGVTGNALIQNLMTNPVAVSMTGQGAFPSTGTPPTLSFATKTSNVPWIELI